MAQVLSPATSQDDENGSETKRVKRRSVACTRCHKQKMKCEGGPPKCSRCLQANIADQCKYPSKDHYMSIKESEWERVTSENNELRQKISLLNMPHISPSQSSDLHAASHAMSASHETRAGTRNWRSNFEDDWNGVKDETFINSRYSGTTICFNFSGDVRQVLTTNDKPSPVGPHNYYKHQSLNRLASTYYKLPPYLDAKDLVDAVLGFIGPDYHLIFRESFLKRLDQTYDLDHDDDYIWICRLFAVFALGELYSQGASKPDVEGDIPGSSYFRTAMSLFQDLYEEPTISYIETLLVIAFYSTALNRINCASTYSGIAFRLSMTLGLHRRPPEKISPVEREKRIRVWMTVYTMDRVCSSKVGLPVMLREKGIDVPPPSMDNLTDEEKKDFHDPTYIIAQYSLSKITGQILNHVNCIPEPGQGKQFVHSLHTNLKSLSNWKDTLPPNLEFNFASEPMYSSRSAASLHLNYGQSVILTTRPILFHRLKSYLNGLEGGDSTNKTPKITDELAGACVHAARILSNILGMLWRKRDLAIFGFFDTLSIFSSTLILMMSLAMKYKTHDGDRESVDFSLKLLKIMRDKGNLPARDYYQQLEQLKYDLDRAAQQMSQNFTVPQHSSDRNSVLQLAQEASGYMGDLRPEARGVANSLIEGPEVNAYVNMWQR